MSLPIASLFYFSEHYCTAESLSAFINAGRKKKKKGEEKEEMWTGLFKCHVHHPSQPFNGVRLKCEIKCFLLSFFLTQALRLSLSLTHSFSSPLLLRSLRLNTNVKNSTSLAPLLLSL